jgi:murein DD-endopeptidase MepM/ murein hydrolase activator NlpD
MGAVRLSAEPVPRFKHTRKIFAGLLLAVSGTLIMTASTGTVATPTALQPDIAVAPPAFFFDDADDALSEQTMLAGEKPSGSETVSTLASRPLTSTHQTRAAEAAVESTSNLDSSGTTAGIPTQLASITAAAAKSQMKIPAAQLEPADLFVPAAKSTQAKSADSLPKAEHPAITAARQRHELPTGSVVDEVTVKAGDTLSGILNNHGVKIQQMPRLLTDEMVQQYLSNLTIGQVFTVIRLPNGDFHSLAVRVADDRRITIRKSASDFAVASIDLPVEKERVVTSGTIEQSLYVAAKQANLKQSTIMELADIFQWELDFARDIRKGDQFAMVYDRLYREGKYIGDGDILAAEFVRGGKTYQAIRFTSDDGETGYYSPEGQSKRRTFMRHPVDVVRITSRFDPNRLHPVLHKIRAHRGVDYGAPYGSPIRATADGKVSFAGMQNTYGKMVKLKHGQKFSTLYAHMSKISEKIKTGSRVKQGDVIGYVGNSGRVTGTHLHYEFRVNNEHVDPLKIELPAAQPIASEHLEALRSMSDELIAQMRSVLPGNDTHVASALKGSTQPITVYSLQ